MFSCANGIVHSDSTACSVDQFLDGFSAQRVYAEGNTLVELEDGAGECVRQFVNVMSLPFKFHSHIKSLPVRSDQPSALSTSRPRPSRVSHCHGPIELAYT